jgi:hypothetical protein
LVSQRRKRLAELIAVEVAVAPRAFETLAPLKEVGPTAAQLFFDVSAKTIDARMGAWLRSTRRWRGRRQYGRIAVVSIRLVVIPVHVAWIGGPCQARCSGGALATVRGESGR